MKDMIICRCEGVYLSDILEAVIEDANSVPGVKKRKRPGMGYCQGRRCVPTIRKIMAQELGIAEEQIKTELQGDAIVERESQRLV